jgi:hypothetical protein
MMTSRYLEPFDEHLELGLEVLVLFRLEDHVSKGTSECQCMPYLWLTTQSSVK